MKKMIKYVLLLLVIAVVGYNSIYIKKLSEVKSQAALTFDPLTFSKKYGIKTCLVNSTALFNFRNG